jgi:hypothetical protein
MIPLTMGVIPFFMGMIFSFIGMIPICMGAVAFFMGRIPIIMATALLCMGVIASVVGTVPIYIGVIPLLMGMSAPLHAGGAACLKSHSYQSADGQITVALSHASAKRKSGVKKFFKRWNKTGIGKVAR